MSKIHELIILGSGAAGCTAAIYAARAGLAPLMIRGNQPGGQLTITTDVENYPGFAEVIQGPWLMEQMEAQAKHCGTEIVADHIVAADLQAKTLTGMGGQVYGFKALIIATGASAKWLGLESEITFGGYGVSACATCDGFFFRNKVVAVVGGGDTAMEEAHYLTRHAKEVHLIHRRDEFRASKIMQDRVLANPKIHVKWNSAVEEILGTEDPRKVTGVRLKNLVTGETSHMDLDGVFIAIGHKPTSDLFKGILEMDENGYLITKPDSTATNIPGVFACGDVQDSLYRQAVTAAGSGCMAAIEAERYLSHQH
jgi:thioredoxin reductase (NADPH)